MKLTTEQVREIREGKAVRVEDPEVGATCVVVLAGALTQQLRGNDEDVPMEVVSRLVDEAMSEYDEDDPTLAIYQKMRP